MGKMLCTGADMADMYDANATEQLDYMHIHADLAKDIGNNLNKFMNS